MATREHIDQQFEAMAEDTDYQNEAASLATEFEASDWEAFELTERS